MIIMAQFILPSDSFGQNKLFASISHLYFVLGESNFFDDNFDKYCILVSMHASKI